MTTENRILISIDDARRRLGIGRTLVYELIAAGRLPAMKLGRRTLIPAAALEAFAATLPAIADRVA